MDNNKVESKLMELKDDLDNRIITECKKYWNNLNMNNNIVFDIKSVDDVISTLSDKAKLIVNELLNGVDIQTRTDTFITIYILMRMVVESYLVPLNDYDISDNNIYSVINLINFRLVGLNAYNKDCDIRLFKKAVETVYLTILRLFITTVDAILHKREAVEAWDYFLVNDTSDKQVKLIVLNSNKVKLSAMREVLSKLGLSNIIIKDNSGKFEKENKDININPTPIKFDNSTGLVDSCRSDIKKAVASESIKDTDNNEIYNKLVDLKDDLNKRIIAECSDHWNNPKIANDILIDINSTDDAISILNNKAKFIENELLDGIGVESRTNVLISIYTLMLTVVNIYIDHLNNYDISDDNIYSVINLINYRLIALNSYNKVTCDTTTFTKGIELAYLSLLRLFIATTSAILYKEKAFNAWDYDILNNKSNRQLELLILDSAKFKLEYIREVISKLGLSNIGMDDEIKRFEKVNKNSDIKKNTISESVKDTDKSILESSEDDKFGNLISLNSLLDHMIDNSTSDIYLQQVGSILSSNLSKIDNKILKFYRNTIYCIVGESGSGKDSLVKYTIDKYKLDPKFKTIVSFTDRPKRDNEIDGVQHHFVSSDEFDDIAMNKEVIAQTKIGDYRYMSIKDNFDNGNIYVIDPKGLKEFKRDYSDRYNIITIYIDTPYKIRKQRVSERSDSDKFIDRSKSEKSMFDDFRKYRDYDYIIDNGDLTSMDDASMILVKILTK